MRSAPSEPEAARFDGYVDTRAAARNGSGRHLSPGRNGLRTWMLFSFGTPAAGSGSRSERARLPSLSASFFTATGLRGVWTDLARSIGARNLSPIRCPLYSMSCSFVDDAFSARQGIYILNLPQPGPLSQVEASNEPLSIPTGSGKRQYLNSLGQLPRHAYTDVAMVKISASLTGHPEPKVVLISSSTQIGNSPASRDETYKEGAWIRGCAFYFIGAVDPLFLSCLLGFYEFRTGRTSSRTGRAVSAATVFPQIQTGTDIIMGGPQ